MNGHPHTKKLDLEEVLENILASINATAVAGSSALITSPSPTCAVAWGQCGGVHWGGATCCQVGWKCVVDSDWYSQCRECAVGESCGSRCPEGAAEILTWQQCGGSGSQRAHALQRFKCFLLLLDCNGLRPGIHNVLSTNSNALLVRCVYQPLTPTYQHAWHLTGWRNIQMARRRSVRAARAKASSVSRTRRLTINAGSVRIAAQLTSTATRQTNAKRWNSTAHPPLPNLT